MLATLVTAAALAALWPAPDGLGHGLSIVHERYFGTTSELSSLAGRDLAEAAECPAVPGVGPRGGVTVQQYNQECLFRVARLNGMTWATLPAFWSVIQPDLRQRPRWEDLDRRVIAALCQNVQPVIRTVNAPSQPAGRPGTRVSGAAGAPPRSDGEAMPQYRAWIRALAERYGPGGKLENSLRLTGGGCNAGRPPPIRSAPAIVVWNEQNKPGGWGGIDPVSEAVPDCGAADCDSMLHYLRMLRAARHGVRDSGRDVAIVVGGLTARSADDPNLGPYIEALYDREIPFDPQFDILAVHPYAAAADRPASPRDGGAWKIMDAVRALLEAGGSSRKPTWILELGWPSCEQAHAGYPAACAGRGFRSRNTDEVGQARSLGHALEALVASRGRWRLERLGLWGLADLGTAGSHRSLAGVGTSTWLGQDTPAACDWCHGSGLWRRDWSAKPAHEAWREQVLRWRGAFGEP